MNKKAKISLSLIFAVIFAVCSIVTAFANAGPFDEEAYTTIVTGSDFQQFSTKAYDRFGRVLTNMKNDGLPTPDTVLVGGDYTKILFDLANPGMTLVKQNALMVYPEMNEEAIICIQGNHDNIAAGFTKTGFYDLGTYNLYCINEDDFQWLQNIRCSYKIQKLADDIEEKLNTLIANGDTRPVIIMTHVPLHHTERTNGADNKYSSYLFDVINEAAKNLDIIFLFGHNHSSDYDDYIGGSVNFMQKGDTIRIPDRDNPGKKNYKEEILNFTYTNCGYIGYSNNSVSDSSTDILTIGSIQISPTKISFTKYSEKGLVMTKSVDRLFPLEGEAGQVKITSNLMNSTLWSFFQKVYTVYFKVLVKVTSIFDC